MSRRVFGLATAVAALATAANAWGYALNAHVAICSHVLDRIADPKGGTYNTIGVPDLTPPTATVDGNKMDGTPTLGVRAGRAQMGTFVPFRPHPEAARIVLANRDYFRAGCGAPDAFPFFSNTDPSHSYGWDPVTQADVLWRHARTDQEKAFVLGYYAHLKMDGAVHAFANTYAALSMRRHGKLQGTLRPQVWDTFTPENFLAHIAAEKWVNDYFIYAARPENYKVTVPVDFAKRMFLTRGSPIVKHYSRLLNDWKPGQSGDVKTAWGEKPGMLATIMHRALEHWHQFEDLHWREAYTWKGRAKYYEGKTGLDDRFHHGFAAMMADWHEGRVRKIHRIYDAWIATTVALQAAVSARGSVGEILKAFGPFKQAIMDYLTLDLIDARKFFPNFIVQVYDWVKNLLSKVSEAVKKVVTEVLKSIFKDVIEKLEEMAKVAAGELIDKYMDRRAREHARGLLWKAGLVGRAQDSEPLQSGAMRPKHVHAGIDGGRTPAHNQAVRTRLLRYPLYRNAFMGVLAVLENPANAKGLPSADFTNGARCAQAFTSTRGDVRAFSLVHKGNDPLYNSTAENCHTPTHTAMKDFELTVYDYHALYASRLQPQPYSIRNEIAGVFRAIGSKVATAGAWLWDKLKDFVNDITTRVTTELVNAYTDTKKAVEGAIAAAVSTVTGAANVAATRVVTAVTTAVKRIQDWAGYNLCNGACTASTVHFLTCWKSRSECSARRSACYAACKAKFEK
jgi:hypothetical protein